jgi:3',5'-cyclic AMP phosphodiesterase CpdA
MKKAVCLICMVLLLCIVFISQAQPPTVLSIKRQSPASDTTNATDVSFRVTFSEGVTGVGPTDFTLIKTGTTGSIVAVFNVDLNGTTYDVSVNGVTGEGSLRLDMKSIGINIVNQNGDTVKKAFNKGQTYAIRQNTGTGNAVLTRGPYLQMAVKTEVTLRWRTDIPTNSLFQAGFTYGAYSRTASDTALTTEHIVRITGLKTGTKFYYRFGSSTQIFQSGINNYFFTAPNPNTGKVRIAVFGDCGKKGNRSNTLSAYLNYAGANPAELMLLLGDNAYEDGKDSEYEEQFFIPYGSTILKNHIVFPVPGNHDYHTTTQASRDAPYFKIFTVPTAGECGGYPSGSISYYSFNWGDIHFISLDSYGEEGPANDRLYDTLSPQVTWLKKDLKANKKQWVIAFWHHPPYTMGSRNSDIESELKKIRHKFIRILERNGVDLVLNGHSHDYERSYLLNNYYGIESQFNISTHTKSSSSGKNDGSPNSAPYETVTGTGNHGTVYVVSGSSGDTSNIQPGYPHNALPFAFNDGGMFYLEIENNRLDGKFIRYDGVIADRFTIIQNLPVITTPAKLDENEAENIAYGLKVFPTVIKRGYAVTITASSKKLNELILTDVNGRSLNSQRFIGSLQLKTGNLPAGMYIIKIIGEGNYVTRRFIVIE